MAGTNEQIKAIKEAYPDIDWDKFEDMDRALNWELWHGPLPSNYWKDTEEGDAVEPLEHYEWKGYIQAQDDIIEILDPLPAELYFDIDGGQVTSKNPEDDDHNWYVPCAYCDTLLHKDDGDWVDDTDGDCCSGDDELRNENEPHDPDWNSAVWAGVEWEVIDPRKVLMYDESWKQVF